MKKADYNVVVVGAGPAGLGAVTVLAQHPHLQVLVADAGPGPDERNDKNPEHTAVGAGGAAMINDGKFTFGLAGTKAKLLPGYKDAVLDVARLVGVSKEDVEKHEPERITPNDNTEVKKSLTVQRPRVYREELIRDIIDKAKSISFMWNSRVTDLQTKDDIVSMTINGKVVTAESCIIATGRLASTTMTTNLPVAKEGRLEVGVRIAALNSDRLFNGWGWTSQVKDPKLIIWRKYKGRDIEIRSFCFCKDGEVVESRFDKLGKDMRVWSGVSDTAPTGMTNLGINVRVLDKTLATELGWLDTRSAGVTHVDDLTNIFDLNNESAPATEWEELLQFAVLEFEKEVLAIQDQNTTKTHGPYEIYTWSVEGVREYMCHDDKTGFVRDDQAMIAVVGDCSGEYRGIVPAMASGIAVTKALVERLLLNHSFRDLPSLSVSNSMGDVFMAEAHIFLGPLNPDEDTIARYKSDVENYNRERQPKKPMKAPVLSLLFRGDTGWVTVLQSARYVMVKDAKQGLCELLADEAYWRARGWNVLRRKLETTVHGKIQGLPTTVKEAIDFAEGGCTTMRLSDIVKAEYLKQNDLPADTFENREEKEKHRPGLLKLLDAKTSTNPLFAARALVTAANRWTRRGIIFVEDVRFPDDVEFIKEHAAEKFDVIAVLLRPPQDVRADRGWTHDPEVDGHISEHAFENVDLAKFACVDIDGKTNVAQDLFDHLKKIQQIS